MNGAVAGRCFIAEVQYGRPAHLNVILTDPDEYGTVVIVNFTDAADWPDDTTTCDVGDHPYFTKPSAVRYSSARRARAVDIEQLNNSPEFGFHPDDVSNELLWDLQCGLMDSRFTPNELKTYCADKFDCDDEEDPDD